MMVEAVKMDELTESEVRPKSKWQYATCTNQEDEIEPAMEYVFVPNAQSKKSTRTREILF